MNTEKMVWKEGMLLRPQHFQQSDRYYDHQLRGRTQLLSPYSWGFFTLVLDTDQLKQGKVIVSEASGVLPDGTYFETGRNQAPLAIDIPRDAQDMPLYLALPMVSSQIETRSAKHPDVLARYLAAEHLVDDSDADSRSACTLSSARPDFRLLLAEQREGHVYTRISVGHIQSVDNNGQVILAPGFRPTYLHFQASQDLTDCVRQVLNQLNSRGDSIAERMRSSGQIGGSELGDFIMLQLINRSQLLLQHYLAMDQLHPEQVYRGLLTLLGDLLAFSSARRPGAEPPVYEHHNQLGSFNVLRAAISNVLSLVLEQHAVELPLEPQSYGIKAARLPDSTYLANGYFVLVASAECDREELRQHLPQHLKIGTVNNIRDLVNLHLPGITLSPLPVAPRQIPYHTQKCYFKLELNPQDLKALGSSKGLALHVSGEFTALELTLWAIRN